jgi:hypothetical protein
MVISGITDFRPKKMLFVYNTLAEMHFQVKSLRLKAILPSCLYNENLRNFENDLAVNITHHLELASKTIYADGDGK